MHSPITIDLLSCCLSPAGKGLLLTLVGYVYCILITFACGIHVIVSFPYVWRLFYFDMELTTTVVPTKSDSCVIFCLQL